MVEYAYPPPLSDQDYQVMLHNNFSAQNVELWIEPQPITACCSETLYNKLSQVWGTGEELLKASQLLCTWINAELGNLGWYCTWGCRPLPGIEGYWEKEVFFPAQRRNDTCLTVLPKWRFWAEYNLPCASPKEDSKEDIALHLKNRPTVTRGFLQLHDSNANSITQYTSSTLNSEIFRSWFRP